MATLTDDDLRALLGEAATSFDAPDGASDDVLDQVQALPATRRPGRWLQVTTAAAAVVVAALVATQLHGTSDRSAEPAPVAQPAVGGVVPEADGGSVGGAGGATAGGSGGGTASGAAATEQFASADSSAGELSGMARLSAQAGGLAVAAPAAPVVPGAAPAPRGAVPAADGARVVKTGAVALLVDDGQVTPVLTRVQGLATAAGGVVASAKTQESGPTPSGSVTLRVPVDRFEEVVAAVRALDAEVRSATTSGQDVTAQYADLEAQLRTLRAARERFLDILSRARSIGDVLAVQQRVDDVTGQIDRLEGSRRVLASQSEKATLEVSVTEADDPAVTTQEKPDDGLAKAFADAWDGFTGGVEALVRASGVAVLLALCLAVAYVVGRLVWRASRRRLV